MAGLSKHLAMAIFNMALNPVRAAYTPPISLWIGLHTAPPSDSTYGSEATFLGYARQNMGSFTANLGVEVAGDLPITITNGLAVTFPLSAGPVPESITHWAVWDSETVGEGNILVSGALGTSQVVDVGDAVVMPEGSILISVI